MKLRKNEMIVPKNSFVPPWRISVFYRSVFDLLGGVGLGSRRISECIGGVRAIGRVTFVGELELRLSCGLVVRFAGLGV